MALINLIKTQKNKLNKFMRNLANDISYANGGWIYFLGRMMINAIILFYVMAFVQNWWVFTFKSYGLEEYTDTLKTLLWYIGLLYLIMKGFIIIPMSKEEVSR